MVEYTNMRVTVAVASEVEKYMHRHGLPSRSAAIEHAIRENVKYYLVESQYVGPNQDDPRYHQACEGVMTISTEPGTMNFSHEEKTEGYLGTTNDYSSRAHGMYDTIEEARKAAAKLGYTEEIELDESEQHECGPVEKYTTKTGAMDAWRPAEWLYESRNELGVTAKTTDEEIEKIAEEIKDSAKFGNVFLYGDVEDYLKEYRESLIDAE